MSPGTNDGPRNTGTLPKSNRRNDRNRERSAINQQIPLPRPVFHRDFSQQPNNLLQLDSQPVSEREPRRSNKNSNTRFSVSAPSVAYHDFPDFENSSRQPSYAVGERPHWQRMAPPFDSHSQPPSQLQGTKPTNVDKMPDRGQVESRLNQIRDYIRVTSTMMDSLSQSTDPRAHAQRDKLGRMVEDLNDSETKLANLLEQYHGRGIPDESGDHVQRTSDQMRRFTDLLDVLALQERHILTNSNCMNGELGREEGEEVRDGGREEELRRKVEESQRKLAQLQEHQANLLGMQLRARERLNEARQAQQALLLEEEQAPVGSWEEANVLPEQGPTNVAQLESETALLRGKLAQLQCKKQRMDHLVVELQAVDLSDRASFSSEGSRAAGRDKAAELEAMKAQLSHLKALMEEATRVRQRSESTSEADPVAEGGGEEADEAEPARSSSNSFSRHNDPEEAGQKKSWNSEDKLTVDQMQAVTRELKEQSALLRAARAELQRLKQPSAISSAAPANSVPLLSTTTPPASVLGTGVSEKKQSNNSTNNNSNEGQQLAQAKRRQLEELMRKEQGHSSRVNQDVVGGDWASHRDTNSQLSHNSSTPANLWPLPNPTVPGGSNDHSMDGVSSSENLLDIGPHGNGFNSNWWGPSAPPLDLPQNGVVGSAEYYRQLLLGSQAQQLQMMGTTVQQCCQLLWAQQRELQSMRTAITQLQLQLRHAQPRTSSAENEEEYSNLSRSAHHLGSGLDAALPPSSSLPNLVSLPIPAPVPTAAPVPSPQHQPQLNNQVPPGNRANNYWDNFRSYSRQNLLSASGKTVTERNPRSTPAPAGNIATPAGNSIVGRINSTLVSRKDKRNREHRADNLPHSSLSATDAQYSLNLQLQSNLHQHQQEREATGARSNVLANDPPQQQQVENLWEEPHSSSSFRLLPGTNGDHCILCHLSGEIQEAMASLVAVNGREPKYLVLILRELKTISEDHRLRPRLLRSLRALQDTHSVNKPLNETTDQTASESCQSSDDDSDIGAYNIGLASNTNTGNHSVLADIKLFTSRPSSPGLAAPSAAHIDNAMSVAVENASGSTSVSGTPGYNEDLAEADQSRPDASSDLQAGGEENDNEDEEGGDGASGGAAALILGNLENSFESLDCEGEGERAENEDASLDRVPTRLYHH